MRVISFYTNNSSLINVQGVDKILPREPWENTNCLQRWSHKWKIRLWLKIKTCIQWTKQEHLNSWFCSANVHLPILQYILIILLDSNSFLIDTPHGMLRVPLHNFRGTCMSSHHILKDERSCYFHVLIASHVKARALLNTTTLSVFCSTSPRHFINAMCISQNSATRVKHDHVTTFFPDLLN